MIAIRNIEVGSVTSEGQERSLQPVMATGWEAEGEAAARARVASGTADAACGLRQSSRRRTCCEKRRDAAPAPAPRTARQTPEEAPVSPCPRDSTRGTVEPHLPPPNARRPADCPESSCSIEVIATT